MALPLGLAGCGSDKSEGGGGLSGFMDDEVPGGAPCTDDQCPDTDGGTDTGDTVGTGGEFQDECAQTDACPIGTRCTAQFDPETGRRLPYTCVSTCVDDMDETAWCSDDGACCNGDSRCTSRGYCQPEPDAGSTGPGTGATTGGTGGTTGGSAP